MLELQLGVLGLDLLESRWDQWVELVGQVEPLVFQVTQVVYHLCHNHQEYQGDQYHLHNLILVEAVEIRGMATHDAHLTVREVFIADYIFQA